MTDQNNQALYTRPNRPLSPTAFVALALLGVATACSANTYLGSTPSEAGSPSMGGSAKPGSGIGNSAATGVTAVGSSSNGGSVATHPGGGNTSLGGATNRGGSTGPLDDCRNWECFRPVECVERCGGPILQSSCCPCSSGTFDSIACLGTGGSAATGGASGGGSSAKGGSNSATGTVPTGGKAPSGGSTSTGGQSSTTDDCRNWECFRAVECVERCGGPILQSSCCPCSSGTFDSIACIGTGGSSSTGGSGNTGGASSTGGSTSPSGGNAECTRDTDCQIVDDCCGCYSSGKGQSASCPVICSSTACSGYDPQLVPRCIAGHCVTNRSCIQEPTICEIAPPQCPAGKLASLFEDSRCPDQNCLDIAECASVPSCDVCKSNGLMCVYDIGVVGVAHCVPRPNACASANKCACFSWMCGGIEPCADTPTGISCGAG